MVNEQGETIALDLEITPELARAGLAREVVRLVQETRKGSGFEVSDRIRLWWSATGKLAESLTEHEELVSGEVLAVEMTRAEPGEGWSRDEDLGLDYRIERVSA